MGHSAARAASVFFVAMAFVLPSCARPSVAKTPNNEAPSPPGVLDITTTVVSADEALGIDELLARAGRHLREQDFSSAARDYRLAFDGAQDERARLLALFGLGTALDLGGAPGEALKAYSRYVAEAPLGEQRDTARVRQVRLLVYLERYQAAGKASQSIPIAARGVLEQVALFAAQALAALEESRLSDAEKSISRGRGLVEEHALDRVEKPSLDVAALFFALGELRNRRAEKIVFDPIPADFTAALEERCQLILDAQSAYSETMRAHDAHWSSLSGIRVAHLYRSLHQELTDMERPATANTEERRQLFEGAIRLRYSILLRKSLSMIRATVALLDRSERPARYEDRARQALLEIEKAQKTEDDAIAALPYSREQLQQVLDEMAARAKASPSVKPGQK